MASPCVLAVTGTVVNDDPCSLCLQVLMCSWERVGGFEYPCMCCVYGQEASHPVVGSGSKRFCDPNWGDEIAKKDDMHSKKGK